MTKAARKAKNIALKTEPLKPDAPKAAAPKAAPPKTESAKIVAVSGARTGPPSINRVSLELVKPGAKTVCVAGSFNEWKPQKTPLIAASDGRWVGHLTVEPGRHEYLFVVDGEWVPDPNAKETVENPFGGKNSVLVVSE
jgi:1,4-alpha-glucan branching enzyme